MPVLIPDIDPAVLIALITALSTLCASVLVAFLALLGVVSTAWLNNRANHNRHARSSLENAEILDETKGVKRSVEQHQRFATDRWQELQTELNACKNELAAIRKNAEPDNK